MCGIAGVISFAEDMRGEMEACELMQRALLRRGPDQKGIVLFPEAALVHTRLAVIDISGGRQPMTAQSEAGSFTIVYNGELYNTEELRSQLEEDAPFRTRSDTEVVLRSFMKWGEDCVERLNGIFAFVIYDQSRQRAFLARDRIGVKPLFFRENGSKLIFASEIPALLAHPDVPHEIDAQGAGELILMAPGRTPGCGVLRGISEVKAGWCGWYTREGLRLREYWRLKARPHEESFEETAAHVRELVLDSIRRQLVSDVPVCTFLSGGLDSSLISSVAAAEMRAQGRALPTFSVDYQNNEKFFQKSHFQPNSDPEYIRCMAEYLGMLIEGGYMAGRVISVAGTATSIVSMREEMEVYDSTRVHGAVVTRADLDTLIAKLQDMPLADRQKIVGLNPQRAPVILAGIVILQQIMEVTGIDEFTVSESDILQGVVLATASR